MHFYAISYGDFLSLPHYTFWELSKNIDRIRAEEDIRFCRAIGSMLGEGGEKYFDELKEAVGDIVVMNQKDQAARATKRLRGMIGGMK